MKMKKFDMILRQDIFKGNKAIFVPFCDEIMLIGDTQMWNFPIHQQRSEVKVQHVFSLSMSREMWIWMLRLI